MSEKIYPCLREVHPEGLDMGSRDTRLKEMKNFINSFKI